MSINDPASSDEFLTGTQEVVVKARIKQGYEVQRLSNGNWQAWKGRHTMVINCLGYDVYVRPGWARL